jgi:hypothetical protein
VRWNCAVSCAVVETTVDALKSSEQESSSSSNIQLFPAQYTNPVVQERRRPRFSIPALSRGVENIVDKSYDNIIDFENGDINTI